MIEVYRNPTYSYLQNNIINRYIHTVSEYTGKDGIANMSLSIYAYSPCRFWSKESVAVGDTIKLSNYEHIEFSFNSFSKDYFREPRQPGGCKLKTAPVRPVVAARPAEYVCSEDLFY